MTKQKITYRNNGCPIRYRIVRNGCYIQRIRIHKIADKQTEDQKAKLKKLLLNYVHFTIE